MHAVETFLWIIKSLFKTDHTQVTLAVQRRVEFGSTADLSIDTIAIVSMG